VRRSRCGSLACAVFQAAIVSYQERKKGELTDRLICSSSDFPVPR
jgi:hypothetical protein